MNKQYFDSNFGSVQFRNADNQNDFTTLGNRYFFTIEDSVKDNPADNFWQLAVFFNLKQAVVVDNSTKVYLVNKPDAVPFSNFMFNELINNNVGSVKVYNVRAFVELTAAQAQAATCYLGDGIQHPTLDKALYPLHVAGNWGGLSDEELRACVVEFGFENTILECNATTFLSDNGYQTEEAI